MTADWTTGSAPVRRLTAAVLALAFVAGAGLTAAACGSGAVASTGAAATPAASTAAALTAAAGSVLFDSSIVHSISMTFSQEDFDAMIAAYKSDGAKEWISATVVIDGKTFADAGLRLKGNSSLRGLGNGRQQGPGGMVSATDPQGLPWLIRLDKNVDGQNYDGVTDIVMRSNNSQTALNEAVSLELLQQAGLASERAIAVRFTVNGSAARLRLATELPDDLWMAQHFASTGALYKAEADGDYTYRGAEQSAYEEVFDQEAGKDNADLTPLIRFLQFVNEADDASFGSALAQKLDVDAFATYLAMEELIGNFDDIDGPGNNSYLYWDAASDRFTVVPWDHNLSFRGIGAGKAPGGRNKTNVLVQRFHANATFEALYQDKLAQLEKDLYASGAASAILEKWVTVLGSQAADLVPATTTADEAAKISAYFQTGATE